MFCTKCGAEVPDTSRFCPACGARLEEGESTEQINSSKKILAIVGYISLIGLLISYIMQKDEEDSDFVFFHQNQALVVNIFMLIFAICAGIVSSLILIIPVIAIILIFIIVILIIIDCIAWLVGIIYAAMGKKKAVPLFGRFHWCHKDSIE